MQLQATNGENAIAETLGELISNKQYRTVFQLAVDLKISADQASRSLYEVPVDQLSKSGADDLIYYLRRLKGIR